ncbi:Helix-turn-helix type 11 domain protein [Methanococcus aeolicus Nankai-3]|uniref:Helix-turn-helix type 11 domain protein n=1 Tax=Methanococcus aeolicus (strain ATCC BAA-1280 / DSM 17508 / OCM 812 / Nankai-3) TaxID=419665 RepID=A6UWR6_META3|nr:HTH domain-containing protein [Methanococcus aeolicus]ABR56938.1 Helix-turn-helix type 11 domain protein [Methanococcus aeolicus Nankai-3]
MEQNKQNNNSNINIDFWTFLEQCYNNNVKIDLGHLKILTALLHSNSNYVSGEYLKKCIDRDSRGAVHKRIRDLKILGFEIVTKSGNFGGYKLIKIPEWFKLSGY